MPQDDRIRWNFIRQADGRWTWQRVRVAGDPDWVSEEHTDLGKLIADAVRHGFLPERHFWVVTQKGWSTQFAAGAAPTMVALGPDDVVVSG